MAAAKARGATAPRDGQTDPFRLGRSRETGELIRVENYRLLKLFLESMAVGTEAVGIVLQILKPLAVVGTVHGLKHFAGVAVEGLTRSAGTGGLACDGAVRPIEDSGGVGDAKLGW